jgi:hypothetical protein
MVICLSIAARIMQHTLYAMYVITLRQHLMYTTRERLWVQRKRRPTWRVRSRPPCQ